MKENFRQSMAWLHTWTGLVTGWLAFFIFVTGTVSYFWPEIDRWMRPELPLASAGIPAGQAVDIADAWLRNNAPDADSWSIILPGAHSHAVFRVQWRNADRRKSGVREYDVGSQAFREPVASRDTSGGDPLWRMHWQLHYMPKTLGILLVGICTMILLTVLITGVVTHKRIFSDFFTFRPRRGQRSWLDLHNILSVVALPFFVMITFSGLVFYPSLYMPSAALAGYGAEIGQLDSDLYPPFLPLARSEAAAPLMPLRHFLAEAHSYWGEGVVSGMYVQLPGDAASKVMVGRSGAGTILRNAGEALSFSGARGNLIEHYTTLESSPRAITSALYGLHEGRFAGWLLRWLLFGSGLLGCAMIATGLILWTVKRRAKQADDAAASFGFRLVECLNVGTIVGLPVGVGVYFWANRLLPLDMAQRAAWEMHSLFIGWALMLFWATLHPAGKAWVGQLSIAAVTFGALPILNLLTTDRHLGVTLAAGDWGLAGFDLTALAIGLLFGLAAVQVRRKWLAPRGAVAPTVARRELQS